MASTCICNYSWKLIHLGEYIEYLNYSIANKTIMIVFWTKHFTKFKQSVSLFLPLFGK